MVNTEWKCHKDEPKAGMNACGNSSEVPKPTGQRGVEETSRRHISHPKNSVSKFDSRTLTTEASPDTASENIEKELENELKELELDNELGELDDEVMEMQKDMANEISPEDLDTREGFTNQTSFR
jgi:hypothetical protein